MTVKSLEQETAMHGLQDLNFKVAPKVHMWFKMEAARRGISMKALLQEMIERYIMEH